MDFINFSDQDLFNPLSQTDPLADLSPFQNDGTIPQHPAPNPNPPQDSFRISGGTFEHEWNGPSLIQLDQLDISSSSNQSNLFDSAIAAAENALVDSFLQPSDDHSNRDEQNAHVAGKRLPLPIMAIAHPNDPQPYPPHTQPPARKRDRSGRFVKFTTSSSQDHDDDHTANLPLDDDDNDNPDNTDPSFELSSSDLDNNISLSDVELDDVDEIVHCKICKKKFGDRDSLIRHHSRFHRKRSSESSEQIRCEICNGAFRTEVNLKRHINNAHTGALDYKCRLCPAEFATDRSLSIHVGKEHADKPPEEGGPKRKRRRKTNKVYTCDFCTYKSDQRFNITRHFNSEHSSQGRRFCPYGCGKVCKNKANMKTHTMSCRQRPT